MKRTYEESLRRIEQENQKRFREAQQEREQKEKLDEQYRQEQVERDTQATNATVQQTEYSKRTYPFVVYTAIIATIAALPVVIQFLLWVAKLLLCDADAP
jgi:uncharacterized membrane protein YcjF (UPF0283 family)